MRTMQSTVLYQWFEEVWNQEQEPAIQNLMAADANLHGLLQPGQPGGAAGFQEFYQQFRQQFNQVRIDIRDVIKQDDVEVALTEVHAVHRESGKEVSFTGMCMARIRDGKIAEAWNEYDFLGLQKQLEAVPVLTH